MRPFRKVTQTADHVQAVTADVREALPVVLAAAVAVTVVAVAALLVACVALGGGTGRVGA